MLEEAAHENIDKNRLGILLSTNLTAAFDTVDHLILKKKMKFFFQIPRKNHEAIGIIS